MHVQFGRLGTDEMILKCVGFEVLTVVVIESSICCDVTPCYLFHAFFLFFLAYSSTLKVEAASSSDTSVDFQHYIQEDRPFDIKISSGNEVRECALY
jgi:hypothetical protein